MELHNFQFFTLETLIIQTIILVVIIWVLNKFLFKPYLAYLDELEQKQKKLEEDYINIDKLIKEAEEEKKWILNEARNKWNTIISDAKYLAWRDRSSILERAEKEAENILNESKWEIEKERLSMLSSIKSKVIELSLKLNSKLFNKEVVNEDFMDKELAWIK